MKTISKISLTLMTLVLLSCGCSNSAKDTGELFKHPHLKFEIVFPGTPKETVEQIPTEIGDIAMTQIQFDEGASRTYIANISEYPKEIVEGKDNMEMIESTKSAILEAYGSESSNEKEIDIGGRKGVRFKFQGAFDEFNVYGSALIILDGSNLMQFIIMEDGAWPEAVKTEAFLGSLKFI